MIRMILLTGWFLVSLIGKIPSYISFSLGIIILISSALAIAIDHQGLALRLTTYAFGVICVGLVSYIRELTQNEKK